MQDAKEEIRDRLAIEDIVGEYVELKRAGRNFKALSPFTSEKTPSFMVSPEKRIWHDFSSNKGGDVFSFVMEVEGMTFHESVEYLAKKAGVDLSLYSSKDSADLAKKRARMLEINKLAERYYQTILTKNKHAMDYVFYKRNLNRKTVANFKIGYSPNTGSALTDFLLSRGFNKQELDTAGVTNRFGHDLFRSRMIIPLMNVSGETIGFTGRVVDPDQDGPKYLNTKQTLIYDKSRHVFGLSQAKESIRKNDYAVVVEGNLDVVSSHQVGVDMVVATAGTALTPQHLKAIARFSENIRLSFDNDAAGMAAAQRAIEIAQGLGLELSIISMPEFAKDPDELVQKDVKLWQQAITKHQPAIDWLLGQYETKLDLKSAAGKRNYSTMAVKLINNLSDEIEKEHYYKIVANKLGANVDTLKRKSDAVQLNVAAPKVKKTVKTTCDIDELAAHQDSILALLLYKPSLRQTNTLDPKLFSGELRAKMYDFMMSKPKLVVDDVDKNDAKLYTYAGTLNLRAEVRYAGWEELDLSKELDRLIQSLKIEKLKLAKQALDAQLAQAEADNQAAKIENLLEQINELNKEIISGKR
ncbi:DNA primase [Candidatus Saccharibacteria bacterium]|nr:DNA primase [Candidatus Saccharibacteria bacterium]